jgi:hypothetical protein
MNDTGWNAFQDPEVQTEPTVEATAGHCTAEVVVEGVTFQCRAVHQSDNEEHRAINYDSKTGHAVKMTWL